MRASNCLFYIVTLSSLFVVALSGCGNFDASLTDITNSSYLLPAEVESERTPDLEGPEFLKPTVYYFAVVNEDQKSCPENAKTPLHGAGGKILLHVCEKTEDVCAMQGSCAVIQNKKTYTFNVLGKTAGQNRFFEIDKEECRYGYGVRNSCLDPFYTLAADLTIYKPGDIIYIPAIEGLKLPDGSKHDGYFVVRDQGKGIKGVGRFDFYTGFYSWLDPKNPFTKLGLGSIKTRIQFYKVSGEKALEVLKSRGYPRLPSDKETISSP